MVVNLPSVPKYSRQWIETLLSRTHFKKPYDRFMWWRGYTPINKPLNIIPAKIEPNAKTIKGISITRGDSCIVSILIFDNDLIFKSYHKSC